MLTFVSMAAAKERKPSALGERILAAIAEEGRTPTGTERELRFSQGHISRLIYGERGTSTVSVDKMKILADFLHVNFEWLVLGSGPMRRGGRSTTPAEEAIVFARQAGCREDAIQAAWERFKANEATMSALDWAVAIDNEARMLERLGVKRPEVATSEQQQIQRQKRKLERASSRAREGEARDQVDLPGSKRRAVGGM